MRIALVSMMRLNSTRLQKKLLVKVGQTQLATRALEILKRVRGREIEVIAAIHPADDELVTLAERARVRVLFRTDWSRDATHFEDCFDDKVKEGLQDEFTWVVAANPSMPFLTPDTLEKALVRVQGGETSSFQTAYKERGAVWDQSGRRLLGQGQNQIFYTLCPAIWAFPVADLGSPERMTIRSILPVQRGPEFLDVTNRDDLQLAQAWARFVKDSYEQTRTKP